ncbi:proline iminopeptidase-family hydrolase [Flavobacterium tyrosinilyticum]|uniref:proline iminopeptidase-family hydrolase n=1 Tax=Flavobacterium tyrosinilyticum TaxID=1658740 RepID=UPI00202EE7E3|nr:proline iminopeptidase-family hydrolase [Flavobacterium tyrosinilyticum]MCM0668917.1 proline iminopeptidase-family hydrolase [Flavobacterium tyrosinilyticum]
MNVYTNIFLSIVSVLFFSACSDKNTAKEGNLDLSSYLKDGSSGIKTGGIKMIEISTPNGKFKVWTKRVGNNPKMKLLLLNGGPGATHEYFECMESFLPQEGIEFIYYDQLGTGNSDNPNDPVFWDLDRYVEEVEQVRIALGLDKSNFYLLGHSWGGILASQYALKYQQNLKGLIISNMMMSAIDYDKYADTVLAKQMDPKVLARIREIEKNKDFENPEYMQLLLPNFYTKHILRLDADKWPEPVNRSFSKINQSLYVTMQGPSEFGLSGKLEKWDIKKELPNLIVPTLSIGAEYDTMDPNHMKWIASQVKNGTYLYCPNGSHMSMYDDQDIYMKGLIKFIKDTDNKTIK